MNPLQLSSALEKELARHLADGPRVALRARPHGCAVVGGAASHEWEVAVDVRDGEATVTVTGASPECRRALRDALIGKAPLRAAPEHHVLARVEVGTPVRRRELSGVAAVAARWARWLAGAVRRTPVGTGKAPALKAGEAAVYWWDERANFGDAVGPWLVQRMSGLEPVNARRRRGLKPALYGVGSILAYIDRDDVDVWGAGLMEPLADAKLDRLRKRRDVRVHAVRGHRTRDELVTKLGWDVPEVYGDPALLLARLYTPTPAASRAKVAFVPHYVHRKHLGGAARPGVDVVDVAEDLERVIDRIANADACVSTSLHGAIIAQAYGVPWVWLRVEDHPLGGDTFKFGDFFSTLDESAVATHDVRAAELATLDLVALGARAALPELRTSLDALQDAFPLPSTPRAGRAFELPPLPRRTPRAVAGARSRLGRVKRRLLAGAATPPSKPEPPATAGAGAGQDRYDELVTAVRATNSTLDAVLRELKEHRRLIDSVRLATSSETMTEVQELVNDRQLSMLATLRRLATTESSMARFGDGEFRLMLRGDFNLRFQRNSPELRAELLEVFRSVGEPGFEVGFPQVFRDAHWSGVWSELWPQLRTRLPETGTFVNSHVTRPTAFDLLRDEAVELWRDVWRDRRVVIVTGAGSRFDADPALFSSAASTTLVESTATHAYADVDRVVEQVLGDRDQVDLALVSLGPAGTVLARRLHLAGLRTLDIGHLSDSYQNVYQGKPRPESKPVATRR